MARVALALFAALGLLALDAGAAPALWAIDGSGTVHPLSAARASLQRTPPAAEPGDPRRADGDPDALRYLVAAKDDELPALVDLHSFTEQGRELGHLRELALTSVPCPRPIAAPSVACAVTAPIRAVGDEIDARHPLVADRSIVAALGGHLSIRASAGVELGRVRVAGPRRTALGPIERHRAKLRFVMVRLSPGGAVPVGGDADGAREVAREAQWRANALWGACGISFGPAATAQVDLVDPPAPHMLVLGCDHGLPASGGTVSFRVEGKELSATIEPGMLPSEAARRVAAAIRARGYEARIYDNPRTAAGAHGTADVVVRAGGRRALVEPPKRGALSSDATLTACIGQVSLEDGLQHFGDVDSAVGTVEERSLLRAYDDADPSTIDVYVVPGFALGGRIGESFIGADGGTLRNAVIVDRAAIRSGSGSFTLAHEIGHVLLDDPGHPDDFGIDTPSRLMDADASDPTAFGPRRLSVKECERVLRQSGPGAPVPLLEPWPLGLEQADAQRRAPEP